jgi:arsenical pump membrane protein
VHEFFSRESAVLAVAAVAVALVAARPRHVPVWAWPLAGTVVLVASAIEPAGAALSAVLRQWNVLAFILGLMGLSAAAQESGVFEWLTELLLSVAGGSRRWLFIWLFLAGAVTTIALSNDATAIVLTPIVYAAVSRRGEDPMPYLFACAFVANTASFGLPFSNPANVLILPHPDGFAYAALLGPPQVLAIAANLGIFLLAFRKDLEGSYTAVERQSPPPGARRTLAALAGVVVVYVAALALAWPLGPVALGGAFITLAAGSVSPRAASRHIGWSTFALLAGLFALLDAAARAGFVGSAQHVVASAARFGAFAVIAGASAGAAILSNILNNLPVAIASAHLVAADRTQHLAYPLIVGVDVGPNLTVAGSLSTILWASLLRERGVRINVWQYLKLGLLVVAPVLLISAVWLWMF